MIVSIAESMHGDVLDVGCGEGLLVERLSEVSRYVTGTDRDESAIRRAQTRTAKLPNARVMEADFLTAAIPPVESFSEIRAIARQELPGSLMRHALYYRYILQWTKPVSASPRGGSGLQGRRPSNPSGTASPSTGGA
jgi:SAM-dependent methyltransferase